MRKLLCFSLCFLWLLGCGKRTIQPIATHFSCDFDGEYDGLAFQGRMRREAVGTLYVDFTQPDSLSGFSCSRDGENTALTLGDMQYTSKNALPNTAMLNMITDVLDDIVYLSRAGTVDLHDDPITGEISMGGYTAVYDSQTSLIQRVEFSDVAMQIQFLNVKQLP